MLLHFEGQLREAFTEDETLLYAQGGTMQVVLFMESASSISVVLEVGMTTVCLKLEKLSLREVVAIMAMETKLARNVANADHPGDDSDERTGAR
jgi:hypothetical protein